MIPRFVLRAFDCLLGPAFLIVAIWAPVAGDVFKSCSYDEEISLWMRVQNAGGGAEMSFIMIAIGLLPLTMLGVVAAMTTSWWLRPTQTVRRAMIVFSSFFVFGVGMFSLGYASALIGNENSYCGPATSPRFEL